MSPETTFSRRHLLSLAGATALGSLAGCTATLPPLGERIDYGRIDVPEPGDAPYTDWLPHPSTLHTPAGEQIDSDGVASFMAANPNELATQPGSVGSFPAATLRIGLDYMGVPYDDLEWVISTPGESGTVLHGDIDHATIVSTLTDTVYETAGEHRGFDLFRRGDRPRVVAVSGTHVVSCSGEHAAENARAIVDTGVGAGTRYVEADDDAATLINAVGDRPLVSMDSILQIDPGHTMGNPQTDTRPEVEPITGAMSWDFEGSHVYLILDTLFSPEDVPAEPAVRDIIDHWEIPREWSNVDIEIGDRIVSVEIQTSIEEVRKTNGDSAAVPIVTWRSEVDRSGGTVTIEHIAGPTIDADRLEVERVAVDISERGIDVGERRDVVGPGDTITVDLPEQSASDDGDEVRLVFVAGDTQTVIFEIDPWEDSEASSPSPNASEG